MALVAAQRARERPDEVALRDERDEVVSTVGRDAIGRVDSGALRAPYWEGTRTSG